MRRGRRKRRSTITEDPGAKQREADRERGAGSSCRDRTADGANPEHDDDREDQSAASCFTRASPPAARARRATASRCCPVRWRRGMTAADRLHHRGRIEREGDAEDARRQERRSHAVRNGDTGDRRVSHPPRSLPATRSSRYADGENQDPSRERRLRAGGQQHEHDQRMTQIANVALDAVTRHATDVAPEQAGEQATDERRERQVVGDSANEQQRRDGEHSLLGARRRVGEEQPCRRRDQRARGSQLESSAPERRAGRTSAGMRAPLRRRSTEAARRDRACGSPQGGGDRDRRPEASPTSTRTRQPSRRRATRREARKSARRRHDRARRQAVTRTPVRSDSRLALRSSDQRLGAAGRVNSSPARMPSAATATGITGSRTTEYARREDRETFRPECHSEQQNQDDRNGAGRPAQTEPYVPRQRARRRGRARAESIEIDLARLNFLRDDVGVE